ncbi:HdeD family acid-resistance protein [Lapidilactobacillus mulanensis]|uniref:HdeD family acid-resistance protein n=1 Tax=Lapidilactobacillus mulanensis TaxID=2485999 RepID=A0ABW4DQK4_9LACO|nr:DUF308 domain-containing protein [Lapidilactobacillus mulanensis]
MDNLVKNIKRNMWLRAILFIVFGLLIALNPGTFINFAINVIALYLVVMGVLNLVSGLKNRHAETSSMNSTMVMGIIELVGALFVWLFAKPLLGMLPFVIGIVLLIHGINYIMQVRNNKRYVNSSTLPSYVYGGLVIIAGIVMIFNPFGSLTLLFSIFGWLLVVMGIAEIFGTRLFKK